MTSLIMNILVLYLIYKFIKWVLSSNKHDQEHGKEETSKKENENDNIKNRPQLENVKTLSQNNRNNNTSAVQTKKTMKYSEFLTERQVYEIIEVIDTRKIHELLHFTNIENLESILENGFFPVELQRTMEIDAWINDINRFDNKLDATSFSIGFPNYKMLYRLRNRNKNIKWIIVAININVLYLHDGKIFYCETNGASNEITLKDDLYLREVVAFKNMFKEKMHTKHYGNINRGDLHIPRNYTTDPQAEILIQGHISNKFIESIYIESPNDYELVKKILSGRSLKYNVDVKAGYFGPRSDYTFWRKEN